MCEFLKTCTGEFLKIFMGEFLKKPAGVSRTEAAAVRLLGRPNPYCPLLRGLEKYLELCYEMKCFKNPCYQLHWAPEPRAKITFKFFW